MARVEQDGVYKDESDKKAKSVNAAKGKWPRRSITMTEDNPNR
jgi:hypothetical protein